MPAEAKVVEVPAKEGWAACPICGNNRLKRIHPGETAGLVYVFCRRCKNEIPLRIGAEAGKGARHE